MMQSARRIIEDQFSVTLRNVQLVRHATSYALGNVYVIYGLGISYIRDGARCDGRSLTGTTAGLLRLEKAALEINAEY